ncbi:hypothetical protein ACFQX7_07965 [Luedemannella flava]
MTERSEHDEIFAALERIAHQAPAPDRVVQGLTGRIRVHRQRRALLTIGGATVGAAAAGVPAFFVLRPGTDAGPGPGPAVPSTGPEPSPVSVAPSIGPDPRPPPGTPGRRCWCSPPGCPPVSPSSSGSPARVAIPGSCSPGPIRRPEHRPGNERRYG